MASVEQRTPVVTSFVRSGGKFVLIKRSQDVGTYQGMWAGFSGYVERLPLNQAYLELWEEAKIQEDQVELQGMGIPVPVDDDRAGRKWLIFPFLFEPAKGVEIATNWEAEEWGWFTPDELRTMKTVPGLETALDRVWPAFGDREFWDGLAHVATNTEEGATELARRGLEILGGFVQAGYERMDRRVLLQAVRAFSACRPSMGVFPDLGARLLLAMEREGGQFDFDALVTELLDAVDDATDLCVNEAARVLHGKKRIFTLSHSEVVADTIVTWHTDGGEVIIAESGPRNEGIALADYLSANGIRVRTVPDVDIGCGVRDSDAVLIGCDGITGEQEIVNKIGTRVAVEAANESGIPVYAVTQTFKIMPPGWPVFLEPQAPADYDEASADFSGGPVFDLTPLDRLEAVVTEEGLLLPARIAGIQTELGSVELIPSA
jgi:translation initiation factor 2B subunit (eIF-2B alpha/beta/delta family)